MRSTLRSAERQYDAIHNEGSHDGYNPHRNERERRALESDAERPVRIGERKEQILRKLETLDCSVALESGLDHSAEIGSLRAEYAAIEETEHARFTGEWTMAVTTERRQSWNARVRAGDIETHADAARAEREQGWTLMQLRKSIKLHNL